MKLVENKSGKTPTKQYESTIDSREAMTVENFENCNKSSVTFGGTAKTMALTQPGGDKAPVPYAIMQICPWYLKMVCSYLVSTTFVSDCCVQVK